MPMDAMRTPYRKVLQEFLEQDEVKDCSIQRRLGTSYEDRLGMPDNRRIPRFG